MPIKHFINVDLPAPFSPISACTVPLRARSWTSLRARTPGNCLEIPSILSTYSFSIAGSYLSFNDHCLARPGRQWSKENSFHERLVVFLWKENFCEHFFVLLGDCSAKAERLSRNLKQ